MKILCNGNREYKYRTHHGTGPGTLPKDVTLLRSEYLDNMDTVMYLDRELTEDERAKYDIMPANGRNTSSLKDKIKRQIESVLKHTLMRQLGYDQEFVDDYTRVTVEDYDSDYNDSTGIKVTVYGELDYDELMEVLDGLNPVVAKYDKYSYFEPLEPGIAEAYIWDIV